jgi:hypothetical protein
MLQVTCQLCRKKYLIQPYRLKRTKFCGIPCRQRGAAYKAGQKRIQDVRGTSKGYVKYYERHEHRRQAELKLGRPLQRGEIVHHKDGNKGNNKHSNLVITTQSEHVKLHWPAMMAARKIKAGY